MLNSNINLEFAYDFNVDRTTHNYVLKKKHVNKIIDLIEENFNSDTNIIIEIDIFYVIQQYKNNIVSYDYFPHVFYSPFEYQSDIQNTSDMIMTNLI